MRIDPDNVYYFFGRRSETRDAVLLDVIRQAVLLDLLDSCMMEANDGGVEVEVEVRGRSVPYVLRHAELFREKHEETGQGVV